MNFKNDFSNQGHYSDMTAREMNPKTPSSILNDQGDLHHVPWMWQRTNKVSELRSLKKIRTGSWGSLIVNITNPSKCFNISKIKTVETVLAKAKTCSLHASLGVFISYLQRSSMRRACRKAFAVSPGVVAKRLSRRLHIAERRGGVTKTHCLGRGAERDESWGSRGDAVSCWPIIEISVKIITICLPCGYVQYSQVLIIRGSS